LAWIATGFDRVSFAREQPEAAIDGFYQVSSTFLGVIGSSLTCWYWLVAEPIFPYSLKK
jgi:hypothetical protein